MATLGELAGMGPRNFGQNQGGGQGMRFGGFNAQNPGMQNRGNAGKWYDPRRQTGTNFTDPYQRPLAANGYATNDTRSGNPNLFAPGYGPGAAPPMAAPMPAPPMAAPMPGSSIGGPIGGPSVPPTMGINPPAPWMGGALGGQGQSQQMPQWDGKRFVLPNWMGSFGGR